MCFKLRAMGMISHGAANGTPPPSVFLGAANSVCWVDAVILDCVVSASFLVSRTLSVASSSGNKRLFLISN